MEEIEWNDESVALLRLAHVRGIGPLTAHKLLAAFGAATRVQEAAFDEVATQVDGATARCMRAGPDAVALERALRWRERDGHHVITWNSARYPSLLREIADPPLVLYAKGDPERLHRTSIAIVGSRNATAQGRRDACDFAQVLSEHGVCIVSGMALGIDTCAHEGGLAAGGSSVAVLGTGIDRVYPRTNAPLAQRLEREGCLVTEFEPGTSPQKGNFPVRNRLISGLSRGVLVVEAAMGSGSLGTARCALEQNRDVFAMPGSIHSPLAKGCHSLIRQGAKLTECAQDVLAELGIESSDQDRAETSRDIDSLLDAMGFAPICLEQLAARSGLSIAGTADRLSRLELDGDVALLAGGLFQRTPRAAHRR